MNLDQQIADQKIADQKIVISGLGIFIPLGRNAAEVREAILGGKSSIAPSANVDTEGLLGNLTSEFPTADTFGLCTTLTGRTDRGVWFTMKALEEAMADAGLSREDFDRERTAVVVGTSHSGIQHSEKVLKAAATDGIAGIAANDLYAALADHVATIVCEHLGLRGVKATISSACSSSNTAIGYGRDLLITGQADRVIIIGTDTISEGILAGFNSLKALSRQAAAPFSNPSGITLGEGAGVLILESLEGCRAERGHHGEVLGYALSSDAFHATSVDETGEGIEAAVTRALANSGIAPAQVEYISAHGTGTDSNDVPESMAVARIFGNKVKIASVKSSVGHTLGASGVVELIISLACAEQGYFAPNNNFGETREGCADLDYVRGPQEPQQINTILCNNYGFGGNNSSLVVSRQAGVHAKQGLLQRRVFVSGYGNYTSHSETRADWTGKLPEGLGFGRNNDEFNTFIGKVAAPSGEKSSARRSSPSIQFAVQAMDHAIANFGLQELVAEKRYETGLIAGLLHGAQKSVEKFMSSIYQDGLAYASSIQFPLTTLNAAAGEVSIKFGIKGFNSTFCGPVGSMKFAHDAVKLGHQERIFDLSTDELTPLVIGLCDRFGVLGKFSEAGAGTGFYLNDGASVTLLESGEAIGKRGGRKLAEVLSFYVAQDGDGHRLRGDGASLAKVGNRAIVEAGLCPEDIDLIIGVGLGTEAFMSNEARALDALFGSNPPSATSVAMHLGYSPTAIFPQMVNLGAAIVSGASYWESDRQGAVWTPKALVPGGNVRQVLVLFTSITFEHCAVLLGKAD